MSSPISQDPNALTPSQVGRYTLLRLLGKGGMGSVYLAQDESLKRTVAIKMMHPHLSGDEEARRRFEREARAVARLNHRNIVRIHDFSENQGEVEEGEPTYLVTEFVDGRSLGQVLKATPKLLPEIGVMLILGLAEALSHAHAHHIIHRDIKPENILVGKDGVVKLTDFGIAQVREFESMTTTGTLIGSPAHMAPEQISGDYPIDERSDIWGLGTVLYTVVTQGHLPFTAENPHQLLHKIVEGRYEDPRRLSSQVDSQLASIVARCLSVQPQKRYANASLLARDLSRWLKLRTLDHSEQELKDFMADPKGYDAALKIRLIEVYTKLAKSKAKQKQNDRALEFINLLFALDPENLEAKDLLLKIRHQSRHRKQIQAILLALPLLIALAFFLWQTDPKAPPSPKSDPTHLPPQDLISSPPKPLPSEDNPPPFLTLPYPDGRAAGEALSFIADHLDSKPDVLSNAAPDQALAPSESLKDKGRSHLSEARRRAIRRAAIGQKQDAANAQNTNTQTEVRLTVFPPAVQLTLKGKKITPGESFMLQPGKYPLILHHPSCEHCQDNLLTLDVPEQASFSKHFQFETIQETLPPATLLIKCSNESYVLDSKGTRYNCNVPYPLKVTTSSPSLLSLSAYSASGKLIKKQSFTLSSGRHIEWTL